MKFVRSLIAVALLALGSTAIAAPDGLEGLVLDSGTNYLVSGTKPVANIAALRALTSSFVGNYVSVNGYYSAANAASDGGGGLLQYVPGDTTTADNGMTIYVDASARRWYRVFNGEPLNVWQIGCVNDGVTDCGPALVAAALLGRPIYFPDGANINSATTSHITLAANSSMIGPEHFGTAKLNLNNGAIWLSGNNTAVKNLTLTQTTSGGAIFSSVAGPLLNTTIQNNNIFSSTGPCVQINTPTSNFLFTGNTLNCPNSYGFLYNLSRTGASNDAGLIMISNNYISSLGDAIELNTPFANVGGANIVVTGNLLTSTANFGVGAANIHQLAITGNYIAGGKNTVHIEDGSEGVVISGNTIVTVGAGDGIGLWIEKNPSATDPGGPVNATGNTIMNLGGATATSVTQSGTVMTVGGTITGTFGAGESIGGPGFSYNTFITSLGTGTGGAGTYNVSVSQTVPSPVAVVAGGAGIYNIVNSAGAIPLSNYSDNIIIGFPICAFLNGPTTYGFANNLLSGCPVGIASDRTIRAVGANRLHNVQTGVWVNGASQIGKLIWDDNSATSIVKKSASGAPGIVLEGFAVAAIPLTIAGSGAQTATIAPVCGLMNGRLRSILSITGGTANGVMRESSIIYNGSTLTETAGTIIDDDVGALTGAAPTVSGGNLIENFSSTGALSNYIANVDFSGTCYQP